MPVVNRLGVALIGAAVAAGCASRPGMHQAGAPAPSSASSAAVMPAPGTGGAPAPPSNPGGVQGAMAATTGAIGGVASGVKDGAGKMVSWMTPESKVEKAADPISMSTKTGKPTTELYVVMADMQEKAGNVEKAKEHYQAALKQSPKSLDALLGMAHLLDRQGKMKEAAEKYKLAAKYHPKDARAWNDLGLCYARQKNTTESVAALKKAIELQPAKPLYRNNIATVLTEMGKTDEALTHLTAVHGTAIAHYNLGSLLYQKGNKSAAAEHFAKAAAADPKLTQARDLAIQLGAEGMAYPQVQGQVAGAVAPSVPGGTWPQQASQPYPPAVSMPPQASPPPTNNMARVRESYLSQPAAGQDSYEPYYRNQLRQQPAAPPIAEPGYAGTSTPDFSEARIATSPRPLPPVDSNEGPPATRQ